VPDRRPRELVIGVPASAPFLEGDVFAPCMLCRVPIRHRSELPERVVLICAVCFIVHADPDTVSHLTC